MGQFSVEISALPGSILNGNQQILLSPLAPLGSCSVVSPTTQDRSVVTTRNNEVVSDPTNVLAIECARRLMRTREDVRLTTVHQVVRPQRFPAQYGWSQHFRLFALAEAGYSQAEYEFEVGAIARHAGVFLRLFDIAQESLGAVISDRRLMLHVAEHNGPLGDRVEKRLRTNFPSVAIDRKHPFASNYYDGIRLLVEATSAKTGTAIPVGDIGVFDWMHKLTSNKRTRFVASGLGIQTLSMMFT
jgi:hypothetical protein